MNPTVELKSVLEYLLSDKWEKIVVEDDGIPGLKQTILKEVGGLSWSEATAYGYCIIPTGVREREYFLWNLRYFRESAEFYLCKQGVGILERQLRAIIREHDKVFKDIIMAWLKKNIPPAANEGTVDAYFDCLDSDMAKAKFSFDFNECVKYRDNAFLWYILNESTGKLTWQERKTELEKFLTIQT